MHSSPDDDLIMQGVLAERHLEVAEYPPIRPEFEDPCSAPSAGFAITFKSTLQKL